MQGHLDVCWRCRARRDELEERAQQFARPFEGGEQVGPEWTKAAGRHFSQWRERHEWRVEGQAPAVWLLETMVQDPAEAAAAWAGESLARLEPVLRELTRGVSGVAAGTVETDAGWRDACRRLHARAEDIGRLTRSLFTVSGTGVERLEVLAASLWGELQSAHDDVAVVTRLTATAASERRTSTEADGAPPPRKRER